MMLFAKVAKAMNGGVSPRGDDVGLGVPHAPFAIPIQQEET